MSPANTRRAIPRRQASDSEGQQEHQKSTATRQGKQSRRSNDDESALDTYGGNEATEADNDADEWAQDANSDDEHRRYWI